MTALWMVVSSSVEIGRTGWQWLRHLRPPFRCQRCPRHVCFFGPVSGYTGSTLEAVRLFGDIEAGDSYTLTLDDQDVTYAAVAGDTMTDVREQLVSAVNGAARRNGDDRRRC